MKITAARRRAGFASIDVFKLEPWRADCASRKAPNVVITPHGSGRSEREHARFCSLVVDNPTRFQVGTALHNFFMLTPP